MLYDRLVGYGPGFTDLPDTEPKLGVHQFMAAIAEGGRGEVTRAQIITSFGITVAEEPDLDVLITKMGGFTNAKKFEFRQVLHDILLLAEERRAYTTRAQFNSRIGRYV